MAPAPTGSSEPLVDLSRASVFLDFDGTISVRDVGEVLMEAFAPPGWQRLGEAFARGELGSRECMEAEWGQLAHVGRAHLEERAAAVDLDPDVARLVVALRAAGADVSVVSDGFGFYVEPLLQAHGVDVSVVTNEVDWDARVLRFPNLDRCCACSSCGTCKQAPVRDAAAAGRTSVFVGDGTSDRKAALLVDVLFATGSLAQWCELNGTAFHFFRDLDDVGARLLGSAW